MKKGFPEKGKKASQKKLKKKVNPKRLKKKSTPKS
jgi:hypothetical protein